MSIRIAHEAGAEQACEVLRRSIAELCTADHGGDEQVLRARLENKTPENVRTWMQNPGTRFLVAEQDRGIIGVGLASAKGEVALNYVAPDARFQGISKTILASLEACLAENGNGEAFLTSTRTAYRFYSTLGYRDAGPATVWAGVTGYPMKKTLAGR